ncbi:copper amine oxidase N-terminal domain-containing protein [Bacillus solimangrovi]|uniref:Copper amine oxidase-like N-terminal domain-containing protein n=1 Tax=Bacillus solimangrovi TaxID=1305675 RepID=A0A1E5LDA7_9BACI|nr:copper amine oxidase N-terminal domain-containing protein [Bacillus solimangrovi]OEH92052.1 hypothetical protein BFG57_16890 [Bacillus solimangrovi]
MNKSFSLVFILLTAFLFISLPSISHAESNHDTKLVVKGKIVTNQLPTIIENGRTLIPLLLVSEAVDAQVKWEQNTSTAVVQKWGERLTLKPDAHQAQLQGTAYHDGDLALETPAKLKNGTIYVPIRLIAQTFGYEVSWIEGEITINSPLSEAKKEMLHRSSLEKARPEMIQLDQPVHYINTPLDISYPNENYDRTYIFPEGEALGYYSISGDTISWIELQDDFLVCTWQAHINDVSYGQLESFLEMDIKNAQGIDPKVDKDMLYYSNGSFGDSMHWEYGKIDKNKTYTNLAYKRTVSGEITDSEGTMSFTLPGEVRTDYIED